MFCALDIFSLFLLSQIRLKVSYVSSHCVPSKMCWKSCLEGASYADLSYDTTVKSVQKELFGLSGKYYNTSTSCTCYNSHPKLSSFGFYD